MSNAKKLFLSVSFAVLVGSRLFTINVLFTVPTVMAMPLNGGNFDVVVSNDEVLSNAQKIQYGGIATVAVRRPNKLHVRYSGDERQTGVFYNGKTFTILDPAKMLYTKTNVPPTIDAAVDKVFDQYGFTVPIADLVYQDPYRTLIENVETGFLVGRQLINGRATFHLAFTQKEIDWQIWIEDGPRPLPRKLLITYKNEPGSPQ